MIEIANCKSSTKNISEWLRSIELLQNSESKNVPNTLKLNVKLKNGVNRNNDNSKNDNRVAKKQWLLDSLK